MSQDIPRICVHPAGEQPLVEQDVVLAPATLDTWAGSVRVEWDPTAPLTPYGQLPFFITGLTAKPYINKLNSRFKLVRHKGQLPFLG
jgi:hypothetical protein